VYHDHHQHQNAGVFRLERQTKMKLQTIVAFIFWVCAGVLVIVVIAGGTFLVQMVKP